MDTLSIENVQSGKNLEGRHAEINKVISGLTKLNKIIIFFNEGGSDFALVPHRCVGIDSFFPIDFPVVPPEESQTNTNTYDTLFHKIHWNNCILTTNYIIKTTY